MPPLRAVFMGTPEFAVPSLKALLDSAVDVVAVYTQPDRPAGRGGSLAASPVKRLALERKLAVLQPERLSGPEEASRLQQLSPGLIVVAAYGLLLPEAILNIPRHGCINVHPSLLPRHRGPSPIPYAILEGDSVTGVTLMLMGRGMDTGPLLAQCETAISDQDTSLTLGQRLSLMGAAMLPATIRRWVDHEITPRPQEERLATYSRLITKTDGEIDWRLNATDLWRRVRAFQPWPGCHTHWKARLLKVSQAEAAPELDAEPGRVVPILTPGHSPVGVGTGKGVLMLVKVQIEGRKEISSEEFLRGQPDFLGSLLGRGGNNA